MKRYLISILLLLVAAQSFAGKTGTWSGPTIHQFFPTIVKALLGNGWALLPSKSLVGDCSDGDVTISAGTTTLARDMFYNNLTINGTGVLSLQNQRVFVCGTLDISAAPAGAIFANGGNGGNGGNTGTAGTAGANVAVGSNLTGRAGSAGGAGTVNNGAQAGTAASGNVISCVSTTNGSGGSGGAGGAGGTGTGGNARARTACTAWPMRDVGMWFTPQSGSGGQLFNAGGAPGGSGGGGDTTNSGGGGGGGGASGQSIYISAGIIKTSVSTPAGVIAAKGGNGGNGGSPTTGNTGGGGGGGGGSGGWAVVKYNARSGVTITGAISATGGTGGTGGTKNGTGVNGSAGNSTASNPGLIQLVDYSTGALTTSLTGSSDL